MQKNTKELIWTVSSKNGIKSTQTHFNTDLMIIFYIENQWYQGLAPFQSNSSHQIMFEGLRGTSYLGDIVIENYKYYF